MSPRAHVVIVGGGISGLAAAHQLTGGATLAGGTTPTGGARPRVTILEREDRLGGKLGSTVLGGQPLDGAADGVLARRPEARRFVEDLGHADLLRPVAASGATVYARGRLRPLPADLQLGIPTSWRGLRRSGVLGPGALARALLDEVAPRRPAPLDHGDASVGALVAAKLGRDVVSMLVDPMLGGIYAGRVSGLGAATVHPALLPAASGRGSLMRALRTRAGAIPTGPSAPGPAFVSLVGGMHSLPGLVADELHRRGVEIVTGCEATALRPADPTGAGWVVETGDREFGADGIIVCVPGGPAARLLRPVAPEAAERLEHIVYASVGVVTFAFPADRVRLPATGTGVLVPAGVAHTHGSLRGQRWLTTALTFLDRKWPHVRQPEQVLLRASVGRIDDERPAAMTDDELVGVVRTELDELLGAMPAPLHVSVTRWPASLPQYPVHHLDHIAAIRSDVVRFGTIELAGAACGGVGVPACIGSGRDAADRLLTRLPPP
ncbi:MAG: protoporphyrinogen oxidase [Acidimicrobiia bacterium]